MVDENLRQIKHLLKRYDIQAYVDRSLHHENTLLFNTFRDLFLLYEFGQALSFNGFELQILNLYLLNYVHTVNNNSHYLILSKAGLLYLHKTHLDRYFDSLAHDLFDYNDLKYHIKYVKHQDRNHKLRMHHALRIASICTFILWTLILIVSLLISNNLVLGIIMPVISFALIAFILLTFYYRPEVLYNADKSESNLEHHQYVFMLKHKPNLYSAWLSTDLDKNTQGLFVYCLMHYPKLMSYFKYNSLDTENVISYELFRG